jgi:aminoglycoside phosphotransferase (APT) family kinase protein
MEVKPWKPERDVDAALARELIAERFFAPSSVVLLGEGWDNAVFLAQPGDWVFRFPRRKIAVPLLQTEIEVLPQIAKRLPLPVPVPELIANDGEWPFAGYRLLKGRTADAAAPTEEERERAAPLLGVFLRMLHRLQTHAPPDLFRRADPARIRGQLRERMPRLGLAMPAFVEEPIDAPPLTTLVHGDLHARQLLFDEGALSGVIDWGDAHRGHPALDLSIAFSFLSGSARAAFFEAYGAVDRETAKLARLRGLHLCVALAVYARDTGDQALQREAQQGIERACQTIPSSVGS